MTLATTLSLAAFLLQAAPQPAPTPLPVVADVDRFHEVDAKLYRGAQPEKAGFQSLQKLGVRTVINLRKEQDAIEHDEQRIVEALGMRYVSLPIKDGNFFRRSHTIPEDTVRRFFAEVDGADGPVFVHCHRGADRTGTLIALYRIARQGWDNQRAYIEARALGMRSWYSGFKRQILAFRPEPAVAGTGHH